MALPFNSIPISLFLIALCVTLIIACYHTISSKEFSKLTLLDKLNKWCGDD